VDRTDAAIRHLKRAVTPQRDDSHLIRLASLRSMRDPTMERLFLRLLQHDSWRIQAYAVLGLAELSEDGYVMPWLITQVQPDARDMIIATAIEESLLGPSEITELTNWKGLEEANRLVLLAYRQSRGDSITPADLQSMAESQNKKVVAAAALLRVWLGDVHAADDISATIEGLPEAQRFDILLTMVMMIRRYEIMEAVPWLDGMITSLAQEGLFPGVIGAGTNTLLRLDPDRGIVQWRRRVGEHPSRREQIDSAIMLLAAGVALPEADRTRIDINDQLVGSIIEAANAVAAGREDTAERIIELADLNHMRSTAVLLTVITDLPPPHAKIVLRNLLTRIEADTFTDLDRVLAIEATERLIELEPKRLLEELRTAKDDSPLQEALMEGLLRHQVPGTLEVALSIRRIGSSRPDALALLLIARDSDELDATRLHELGLVTSGARLANHMQAQAAWLYLRHTDGLEDAMAHLVPER
jgi:hypothetical protein